ncbi:MAG: glycogen debranching enzyme family protein [Deltaproteobacteria bacterium]|nr:glycogen debranching enzyme family protein [Deltaproteobacteria bacterium]
MPADTREWLVANGLGGYAFGPATGGPTRSYHALLVSALEPPQGREISVQHVEEHAVIGRHDVSLDADDGEHLVRFSTELGLPVWRWRIGPSELEKRLCMVHGENTTVVTYRNLGPAPVEVRLRPWLNVRGHNEPLDAQGAPLTWRASGDSLNVERPGGREIGIRAVGGRAAKTPRQTRTEVRALESKRGYGDAGPVECAGALQLALQAGEQGALVLSTGPNDIHRHGAQSLERERKRREQLGELSVAADAFLIRRPVGLEPTVVAGYPWFADWGRDTFIALEGLTLTTRRGEWARAILERFAAHTRDGLIPNHFPDGPGEIAYNTADATLWFIHALGRYEARTSDGQLAQALLPRLREIIDRHLQGTRFGIGVDPADGLLRQGAPDVQLTWMDAKVGDWVVTPRRGKAVELNALWFQALRLVGKWANDHALLRESERVRASFNERFWCELRGHLFDVVDGEQGDDASLRPNQLFALSLPEPVLARERWLAVLEAVRDALLTPFGLRTLAPSDERYRGTYAGDVRARDAAYHNGTVWPWLMGAWVDANLAFDSSSKSRLLGELQHLRDWARESGTVAEVFSGDAPHAPEGCVAQAWSVAELLRAVERCG